MNGRTKDGKPIIMYGKDPRYYEERMAIMLGHSCDEWNIGTPTEAREFIKLLEDAIEKAEKNPNEEFSNQD